VAEKLCIRCGTKPARRRLRCATCANYLDVHGHDRPIGLVIASGRRRRQRVLDLLDALEGRR